MRKVETLGAPCSTDCNIRQKKPEHPRRHNPSKCKFNIQQTEAEFDCREAGVDRIIVKKRIKTVSIPLSHYFHNPSLRTLETPPEHVARSRSHTERVRHLDGLLDGGQKENRLASKKKHTFWILRFEEKATRGGRQLSLSRLSHLPLRAGPNFFNIGVNQVSDDSDGCFSPHAGKAELLFGFFSHSSLRLLAGGFNIPLCTIWTLSSSTKKSESGLTNCKVPH